MWMRMRSCPVDRASDSQHRRNCPEFDPSILRHSGIWGAADEAVLNIVHKKKKYKKSPFNSSTSPGCRLILQDPPNHPLAAPGSCLILLVGALSSNSRVPPGTVPIPTGTRLFQPIFLVGGGGVDFFYQTLSEAVWSELLAIHRIHYCIVQERIRNAPVCKIQSGLMNYPLDERLLSGQ